MPAEETTSRKARGWCVFIGAAVLGLISGLGAGMSFGAMIDEVIDHIKDLNVSVSINTTDVELITAVELSTQGFAIGIISTTIGIELGVGVYNFLITIEENTDTALSGAASAAMLGITACGAAIGAICSNWMLSIILQLAFIAVCIFFLYLLCKNELAIYASIFYLSILTYGILFNTTCLGIYSGMADVFIHLSFLFIFLFVWYVCHGRNHCCFKIVFIVSILLFTVLFFVGNVTAALSAGDEGPLIRALATQLLEVAIGNVVYLMYSRDSDVAPGKVCAGAAALSTAVLVAIQESSSIVNTQARLWALTGISGSAGVALAAAGDLGQMYGKKLKETWVGILGTTAAILGAAAGAFFTKGTKKVSFGLSKAMYAAIVPGMPFAMFIIDLIFCCLLNLCNRIIMNVMCWKWNKSVKKQN